MLKLFLFFLVFSITIQSTQNYSMIVDSLFKQNQLFDIYLKNCPQKNSENLYYRGKPENFLNIKNNYDSYSSVYVPSGYNYTINSFKKFPKSTLFITESQDLKFDDYCFIAFAHYRDNENKNFDILNSNFYYVIINSQDNSLEQYLSFFILMLSIYLLIFLFCYKYNRFNAIMRLYVSKLTNKYLIFSLLLDLTCILINYITISSIAYSFYKTFIIVHIIYLLLGNEVLYFRHDERKKVKYTLILLFIELSISVISLYIIYFIPSLDNFYLYFTKSLIEHIAILVFLVKMFLNNYINLYRQYRLERRMRTILTISYKYKLLLYTKIFIFSLLYSLVFIVVNIIKICSHLNYNIYGFIFNYYLNIALEQFFAIILGILFYPVRNSPAYYNQVHYKLNSINFIANIKKKKEKYMRINNLTQKLLKNEYVKSEYPLILVEPFTKNDKIFDKRANVHIGVAKID